MSEENVKKLNEDAAKAAQEYADLLNAISGKLPNGSPMAKAMSDAATKAAADAKKFTAKATEKGGRRRKNRKTRRH